MKFRKVKEVVLEGQPYFDEKNNKYIHPPYVIENNEVRPAKQNEIPISGVKKLKN